MGKHIMTDPRASTVPSEAERDEVRIFHHNALRVLGENYLVRAWLPKKGPAFVAMILAMRAHIWYDFGTGEQKTRYFPEAETIAKFAGISRASVFRLLNDPDMGLFIRRAPRRRYSAELQREVQTSNIYWVAMDDPPMPEDRHLVETEQRRIEAILRGDHIVEDDERPARSRSRKSSESQFETLKAVSSCDSDSRLNLRREDRDLRSTDDHGVTSIGSKGSGQAAIRSDQTAQPVTQDEGRRRRGSDETWIAQSEADRHRIGDLPVPPRRPLGQVSDNAPTLTAAAMLSEGEAWRVDAEDAAGYVIESVLREFGDLAPAAGRAAILSIYQHYCPPVAVLVDLARLAKRRVQNRGGHIDSTAPGYFIRTMQNLAKEARRDGWDVGKLIAKSERKQIPAAQRAPTHAASSAPAPRQSVRTSRVVVDRSGGQGDYYDRLNAASRGR